MPSKRHASRSPEDPRQSKRPQNGGSSPEEGEVDDPAPPTTNGPIIAPISLPQKVASKTAVPFPFKPVQKIAPESNVFAQLEENISKQQKDEPRKPISRPPKRPPPGEGLEPLTSTIDDPPTLLSRLGPPQPSGERDSNRISHSSRRSRSPATDHQKHRLPPSNRSYEQELSPWPRGYDKDYPSDRDRGGRERDRGRGRERDWERGREWDREWDRNRDRHGRHERDDPRHYRPSDSYRSEYRDVSRSRSRERERERGRDRDHRTGYNHRRSPSPPPYRPRAPSSYSSPKRRALDSYNRPPSPPKPDPPVEPPTPPPIVSHLRSPSPQPPSGPPPPPPPPTAPPIDPGPRPPSSTPPPAPPPDTRLLRGIPHLPPVSSNLKNDIRRPEPPPAPRDAHSPPPLEKIPRPTDRLRADVPSSYPPSAPASGPPSQHRQQQLKPPGRPQGPQPPRLPPVTRSRPVKGKLPQRRPDKIEHQAYGHSFVGCGRQTDYEATTKLGEGTFGEVHKAIHKTSKVVVALKRILMHNEKEGMPVTALREIKILKALKHPCIVDILDMFVVRSTDKDPLSVYMVFPYMDHDLAGLLENDRVKLSLSHIKLYMKQLLEGTEYMHRNHILHRDMKAANLLISNDGRLRIADFGLARAFDELTANGIPLPGDRKDRERKYTNCVVTRWYRPPELLMGSRHYGGEVDIWGVGCVMGEMFFRKPILPGTSDLDQLEKIWSLCGAPNQQNWPNHDKLPGCEGIQRWTGNQTSQIRRIYGTQGFGDQVVEFIEKLLTINPKERITASQALEHDYFWVEPLPADPKTMPSYESSHEYDKRGQRHHVQAMNMPNGGQMPRHPGAGGPQPHQPPAYRGGGARPPPGPADGVQPFFGNDPRARGPPPPQHNGMSGMPPPPHHHQQYPHPHSQMGMQPPPMMHMPPQGMPGMPPNVLPPDMSYGGPMPPQMLPPYPGGFQPVMPPGMPPAMAPQPGWNQPGPPGGGYGGGRPPNGGGGGSYRGGGGGGGRMPDNYNNFPSRNGNQPGRYNNDRRDYHNGSSSRNHDHNNQRSQQPSLPPPIAGLPPRPSGGLPPLNRDDRERDRYDRNANGRHDRGGYGGGGNGGGGGYNDRRPDYPPASPPQQTEQPDVMLEYS